MRTNQIELVNQKVSFCSINQTFLKNVCKNALTTKLTAHADSDGIEPS